MALARLRMAAMRPIFAPSRVNALLGAGLLDSFGLSLGWTAFILIAVGRGGLAAAGLYNAAMLAGVVCSAPVAGWIAHRVSGRTLLTCTGSAELVLRVGTLAGLLLGWPPVLLAAGIAAMNVAAWAGYAGMRAEVAAADPGARSLTRYAVAIAAVEAIGAGAAALLPISTGGQLAGSTVLFVLLVYGSSVTPQFLAARSSRVRSGRTAAPDDAEPVGYAGRHRQAGGRFGGRPAMLAGGALVMLLASGPVTLGTALAQQLYGHAAVGFAAMTFSAGCLLAGPAAAGLARLRLPGYLSWTAWGVGMVLGWLIAPWQLAGLLVAQLFSAVAMTAFQGEMDAAVAESAGPGRVTSALAWAASVRASGSAVAVRLVPVLVTAPAIGLFSAAATGVLLIGAISGLAIVRLAGLIGRRSAIASRDHAGAGKPAIVGLLSGIGLSGRVGSGPTEPPTAIGPRAPTEIDLPAEPLLIGAGHVGPSG